LTDLAPKVSLHERDVMSTLLARGSQVHQVRLALPEVDQPHPVVEQLVAEHLPLSSS